MDNNNINTLTFDNHDTYIYYNDEQIKSTNQVILTPTNPEDTDIVNYRSREAQLFTNGVNNGLIKFNGFTRTVLLNPNNPIGITIGTIITNNGILMFNYATERQLVSTTGLQTKSLANYKSGKYANYNNIEVQLDFEDGYRIVTISY